MKYLFISKTSIPKHGMMNGIMKKLLSEGFIQARTVLTMVIKNIINLKYFLQSENDIYTVQ